METIDSIIIDRAEKVAYRLHHLCLDKGYDYEGVIEGVVARDYILHLKRKGAVEKTVSPEKKHPARRWVVERPPRGTTSFGGGR